MIVLTTCVMQQQGSACPPVGVKDNGDDDDDGDDGDDYGSGLGTA